jgi:potassium uptake TrkH family protein
MIGSLLLWVPASSERPGPGRFMDALFTSVSAVTVTGLNVVDTATHWTAFGQLVILLLIQIGGFGIVASTSLLAIMVSRRIGLTMQLSAQTETTSMSSGDVLRVLRRLIRYTAVIELVVAALLTVRFAWVYDESVGRSLWLGAFHGISAFNNAGFALFSDSLERFVGDAWINLTIDAAVVLGGLGFPVLHELRHEWRRPNLWSLSTRMVVLATGFLLAVGTVTFLALEWGNERTLGQLSVPGKLLASFTMSVMPRTAGFASVNVEGMQDASWLFTDVLMFIGGGSASTAGGVKISTVIVLVLVVFAAARGQQDVRGFGRRIDPRAIREATVVFLLFLFLVLVGTGVFVSTSQFSLDSSLYEVISAVSTVGLSHGITADLTLPDELVLIVLMFVGRVGPATVATALALRRSTALYYPPVERPMVG